MILLADRHIPWLDELLPPGIEPVRFDGGRPPDALLASADAMMIRTVTRVDASLLRAAPRLRWLGTATAGFDHIDTQAVADAGIPLYVAAGCNASAVGDYVRIAWREASGPTPDTRPASCAVIGHGHTGKAAAARLASMGVAVVPYDPPLGLPATWEDVLACEAVTVHVPLTFDGPHKTHHLLSEADFARARWRVLIQASRGGVVDESALKGWIRGGGTAVVDVWENEPAIDPELCDLAALATPHIAGYSVQAKVRATKMCVERMCSVFRFPFSVDDLTKPIVQTSPLITENRKPKTENVLRDLSDALKRDPSAETFKALRNHTPLRVEAE